jgi:hypothetical protein
MATTSEGEESLVETEKQPNVRPERLLLAGVVAILLALRLVMSAIWLPPVANHTAGDVLTVFFILAAAGWIWLVYVLWFVTRGTAGDLLMRWALAAVVVSVIVPNVWPWLFGNLRFVSMALGWLAASASAAVPFLLAFGTLRSDPTHRWLAILGFAWGLALLVSTAGSILVPIGANPFLHGWQHAVLTANMAYLLVLGVTLIARSRNKGLEWELPRSR